MLQEVGTVVETHAVFREVLQSVRCSMGEVALELLSLCWGKRTQRGSLVCFVLTKKCGDCNFIIVLGGP